jgi:hypothetical protein
MKKFLLLCLISIPVLGYSQVKNAGCFLRMVSPENNELSMENDSVKISFSFDSMNFFCKVSIQNKTSEVIEVDWDKFIMVMEGKSQPILFENTPIYKKDDPKGTTPIVPETSLDKWIAPVEYIELEMSLYNKGWVKKHGDQEIGFLIPLVYGEKAKYYNCKISVSIK